MNEIKFSPQQICVPNTLNLDYRFEPQKQIKKSARSYRSLSFQTISLRMEFLDELTPKHDLNGSIFNLVDSCHLQKFLKKKNLIKRDVLVSINYISIGLFFFSCLCGCACPHSKLIVTYYRIFGCVGKWTINILINNKL